MKCWISEVLARPLNYVPQMSGINKIKEVEKQVQAFILQILSKSRTIVKRQSDTKAYIFLIQMDVQAIYITEKVQIVVN